MSRYRGPKLRITRRLGTLPGLTQKNLKENRSTWPTWENFRGWEKENNRIWPTLRRKTKIKI